MKTTFIKTICFGTLLASMAACDILDVDPLDTYTEEDVFSDVSLLKSYVHRNYNFRKLDGIIQLYGIRVMSHQ